MRDAIRLAVIGGVMVCATIGWGLAGYLGAAFGLMLGLAILVVPWRRLPLWSWAGLYLGRNRRIDLTEPLTVANDRSGGGVRYQDGVAAVAVQILGRRHQPTYFTGSTATATANTFEIGQLIPLMHQSLGLTIESISVVSSGARRRATGDYPRVYDTLIGTPPYAGQRETWLVIRIRAMDNGDALRWRSTVGTAALAAAQRITMMLRCSGIRARTATATDIVELERRLGRSALEPHNRRWHSARSDGGWQTAYAYRPSDITTENLAQAWSIRADGIVQNVTLFPDGTASALVITRTPQPPTAPPVIMLQPLPGEQAQAVQAQLCCPRAELRALGRGPLRAALAIPIGASGVLLGKTAGGDRLLMPLSDPGEPSRVHIVAEDAIAKRIVIRAAAAGERITVHTNNLDRWDSVRMPHIAVIEHPRPAAGTTLSVIDGTVPPAPRPSTVISVAAPGTAERVSADIVITQTGPASIEVATAGERYDTEVEFFRAENRYMSRESVSLEADLEMVD
ncbi:MAG: type VII secretion protein EccE [Mycobacteriaceae bacterium]